jgi:flagellar protein FliS
MSYSHAASTYRAREVQTATPGRLVVIVYDHVIAQLTRAGLAHKAGNVEARVVAVSKARTGIFQLLGTLDCERGGELAKNLKSLYGFFLTELQDYGRRPDANRLAAVIRMVSELRDAFATIATDSARSPAA